MGPPVSSRATGRRFTSFRPLITVHNSPPSRNEDDEPWITDCIEPGEGKVHVSEFFSNRSKKRSLGASLKISPPDPVPVGGDLSWARDDSEEWTETYRYTVQGTRREHRPGRRNKDDQIYWNAEQGKLIRTGIDMIQVAFVVLRQPGYDLQLKFELDSDVSFKYKLRKGWKNFWGLPGSILVSELKVYNDAATAAAGGSVTGTQRKLRDTTVPKGVDRDYLIRLEGSAKSVFRGLSGIHDIEAVEPYKYYGKKEDKNEDEDEEDPDDDDDVFFDAQS